jgi:rare lipoprotein A
MPSHRWVGGTRWGQHVHQVCQNIERPRRNVPRPESWTGCAGRARPQGHPVDGGSSRSCFTRGLPPSPAVTEKPGLRTTHRPVATNRHAAAVRKHTPYASNTSRHVASHGVASFYTAGTLTANGERFDTNQLTAAHPTLPFGTRLRVTNVATGQSVTVRVNDRGPFTRGRIVDVSYSAAESLGMVGNGVAKVKLDVVQ